MFTHEYQAVKEMTDKIQSSEMVHTKYSCVNCGEITHRDAPLSATISMGTVCRFKPETLLEVFNIPTYF